MGVCIKLARYRAAMRVLVPIVRRRQPEDPIRRCDDMKAIKLTAGCALTVVAFLLVASSEGHAAACGAQSLQKYIDLGAGGCTFNDLKFSDFNYDNSGGTERINASDITVGQDSLGASYGLMFSASWDVTNTDVDSKIEYDVTVLNNKKLVGEMLLINGAMLSCTCSSPPGDGSITGTEDTLVATLETFKNRDVSMESDSAMFAGRDGDSVTTEVFLMAGPFSTASLQSTSNLFDVAAVPEPSSLLLLGSGFLGLVGCLRKRSLSRANAT
jgi:PEP-CTERM motif